VNDLYVPIKLGLLNNRPLGLCNATKAASLRNPHGRCATKFFKAALAPDCKVRLSRRCADDPPKTLALHLVRPA
jgi:hypothetical protein